MRSLLYMTMSLTLALLLAACATIGTPEGGPRDYTPPRVVRTNPPEGSLNFQGKKVTVRLNKNIELNDAFNKVVVSPAQKNAPTITSNAKTVTIELRDSLLPNTTYTIDFADAIRDINEGNILDGFATAFSTGDFIDTLRISGMVLEARTLEPAQGIYVGVYSNLADSAITTLPLERITKTNQRGQFTLRNLPEGSYRLFAVNDINRDYHWDRSEDVAFYPEVVTPRVEHVTLRDSLRTAVGRDSLALRTVPRYLPNDLLLTWFNENYQAQYLKEYSRPGRHLLSITLGAPADSLPPITLLDSLPALGGTLVERSVLSYSATNDSIEVWLRDSALISLDTLNVAIALPEKTDTVRFVYKPPKTDKKQEKKKDKEKEKGKDKDKDKDKDGEGEAPADSLKAPEPSKIDFTTFNFEGGSQQELNMPALLQFNTPLDTFDVTMVRLEQKVDTLWYPIQAPVPYIPQPNRPMTWRMDYAWAPSTTYRITVDSAAVADIFGRINREDSREFTTKALSDYGTITFRISGLDSLPAAVELLNGSDNPLRKVAVKGGKAYFDYLAPGTYYARLFIDRDSNLVWSNGSLSDSLWRLPADVYYYPKVINLKKNWEIDQSWDINAVPVDRQKPFDLIKNKPKDAVKPADDSDKEEAPIPPGLEGFY